MSLLINYCKYSIKLDKQYNTIELLFISAFEYLRQPTIVGFNLFYKLSLNPLMDDVETFET